MLGASRDSLLSRAEALDADRSAPGFDALAAELFAVAELLDQESALRSALGDSGQQVQVREGLAREIFAHRISTLATNVVCGVVSERWSKDTDMVIAIERLAEQAAFTVSESEGTLDATEEELFLFGRALDGSSDLQMALTNPAEPPASKAAIVRDLLAGRCTETTQLVLVNAVSRLHGQRIDAVVEHLCELAAKQRQRVVAEIRVAAPLTKGQQQRLADVLTRIKGRTVRLNIAIDPTVLGGVYAKVGDEVIDGTVSSKLEQARRAVLG